MPDEILIKGGHVVTMDPELGDRTDSDVLVRDGVIVEVGPGLGGWCLSRDQMLAKVRPMSQNYTHGILLRR
jgi:hypothetical protein